MPKNNRSKYRTGVNKKAKKNSHDQNYEKHDMLEWARTLQVAV